MNQGDESWGRLMSKTKEERFWLKVRKTEGCWEWVGGKFTDGYGRFANRAAHRAAWEIENGEIPKGMHILHRCNNPGCVRVSHLYLGTDRENADDRIATGKRKRHCVWGHEFTEENTKRYGPDGRYRLCRECMRVKARRYQERIRGVKEAR
jgi:hypothetical protein